MWEDFDSGNRKFICLVVFAVLFLWGPVDRSWPFWLALRIAYLIAAPLIAMVILKWVWRRWKPDDAAEDRLALMLLGGSPGRSWCGRRRLLSWHQAWNVRTHSSWCVSAPPLFGGAWRATISQWLLGRMPSAGGDFVVYCPQGPETFRVVISARLLAFRTTLKRRRGGRFYSPGLSGGNHVATVTFRGNRLATVSGGS